MPKKELSLRERRKIYEDTITVVAQTQKLTETSNGDRVVQNVIKKQYERCSNILATVLGYHESYVDDDGKKCTMLLPDDNDEKYAIEKEQFNELVKTLPQNKLMKECLWKSFVKRDKKSVEKFKELIA